MSPKKRHPTAQKLAEELARQMEDKKRGLASPTGAMPKKHKDDLRAFIAPLIDELGGLGTYILDENRQPVKADTLTWARWCEEADRHVAHTFTEHYEISTVFLGLDHSWGKGPPVLYETMVFGKSPGAGIDHEMDRYCTWEEAENGHADMVRRVLAFEHPPEENKA